MKQIELKTVETAVMKDDGVGFRKLSYKSQLKTILQQPFDPQAGMTADEMVKLMPVFQKIEGWPDDGAVLLEDAEHQLLLERVNRFRFPFFDMAVVGFITAIREAEDYELSVAPDPSDDSGKRFDKRE